MITYFEHASENSSLFLETRKWNDELDSNLGNEKTDGLHGFLHLDEDVQKGGGRYITYLHGLAP